MPNMFTTDNGTENFSWPDGGVTPFFGGKGTTYEGGFRAPAMVRWPGKIPANTIGNGLFSGLDWFPTFVAAAGNPNIVDELKKGKELNGQTYKVHLDGTDQTAMLTGKGPSTRHEIWYFAESALGAARIDDTNTPSRDSRTAGSATRSPSVLDCGELRLDRLNGRHGPREMSAPTNTWTVINSSSGGLFSSSRRSRSWRSPLSNSRRCSPAKFSA